MLGFCFDLGVLLHVVVCLCCVVFLGCLHSWWPVVLFSFWLVVVGCNLCWLVFALVFLFAFGFVLVFV